MHPGLHSLYTYLHPRCQCKHKHIAITPTDKKKEFMGNGVLLPPLNPAIMPRGASGFSGIR